MPTTFSRAARKATWCTRCRVIRSLAKSASKRFWHERDEQNIATRVIAGVSFVDAACTALELDPLARGLQIADATDLARQHFPHLDPDQPALIGQLYSRAVASDCKLTLLALYPPEHAVTRVNAAGTPAQQVVTLPLAELDRTSDFGLLTTLYVPPLARPSSMNALGEVVAHLRAPEGCPWDRTQTHQSLRKDFLEECYEVLETLDADDIPHLCEELGDLLLHIFLQAQIAAESGEFLLTDVVADIAAKLVRRHPHVFGDVKVNGTDRNHRELGAHQAIGEKRRAEKIVHPARAARARARTENRQARQGEDERRGNCRTRGEIVALKKSRTRVGRGVVRVRGLRLGKTDRRGERAAKRGGEHLG